MKKQFKGSLWIITSKNKGRLSQGEDVNTKLVSDDFKDLTSTQMKLRENRNTPIRKKNTTKR